MSNKEFYFEQEVGKIENILTEINDERTVMMAPKIGSSSGPFNTKLRVYSYGNIILELSTTKYAKCKYIPNKKLIPDGYSDISESIDYEKLSKEKIERAIGYAKQRANGDNNRKKYYEERSVETALIYKNRRNAHEIASIIDMEFGCPTNWIGNSDYSTTVKPDLVIYDRESKCFGIIELKCNNNSCDNIQKHVHDFWNITNSSVETLKKIKDEFVRKINYLQHYRIIQNINENDIDKANENNIWMAFLFIGGVRDTSETYFEKRREYNDIDPNLFGFNYYHSLDDEIDFRKSAFFNS